MERALVVGSTGYVGSHLVRALIHSDMQVEAMRRWNSSTRRIGSLDVETRVADLLDPDSLVEILAGYNYVFMAAAPAVDEAPRAYLRKSVLAIRHLLDVSRTLDVERVILTSCATTVAPPAHGEASVEEDVYLPGSAGDHIVEAHYAVEQECYREAADGMDIAIVMPGICIGPDALLPSLKLLEKLDPDARINLVDVDDVARAHIRAARRQSFGQRYLLGGENTTVGQLCERLEPMGDTRARLGRYEVRLVDKPDLVRRVMPLYRQGHWLDAELAEQRLGFRPRAL